MKTLEEVIKAFEICIGYYCSNAEHDVCPYIGESDMGCMKEPEKDALHYLKEFQGLSKMWNDHLDKEQENPPLTWDELKSMVGKPVWVETKTKGGRWMILSYFGDVYKSDDTVMFASGYNGGTSTCYKKNMGITWQVYRKERK